MKFIFVTGGVVSSLGKGLTAASLAAFSDGSAALNLPPGLRGRPVVAVAFSPAAGYFLWRGRMTTSSGGAVVKVRGTCGEGGEGAHVRYVCCI